MGGDSEESGSDGGGKDGGELKAQLLAAAVMPIDSEGEFEGPAEGEGAERLREEDGGAAPTEAVAAAGEAALATGEALATEEAKMAAGGEVGRDGTSAANRACGQSRLAIGARNPSGPSRL